MKKIFFIHNSLPEYRIAFWKELNKYFDIKLLVTDQRLEKKIYGFEADSSVLEYKYYDKLNTNELKNDIKQADAVILPSADKPKEVLISVRIHAICRRLGIPYFYWNEKWVPEKSSQPYSKRLKNYIQKILIMLGSNGSACYISSGTKSKEYLREIGIEDSRIEIAFDSSLSPTPEKNIDIRKKYGIPKESSIVLYLGRLISRKGCRLLIEAVKDLKESKQFFLLVCGAGEEEESLKKSSVNSPNIIFCGKIQPSQRRLYYEQADLFVLPSIIERGVVEAWGLTVNEALEAGTPVITTTAVGAAYDLIDDNTGAIIQEGDQQALKDAIYETLNRRLNRSLCKKKYSEYSVQQMAKEFAQIIDNRI